MEENYSGYAIVAPFQTAQLLAIPQLGYVSKPFDVTIYGMRATLGLKPFTGLKDLDLRKTIFIGYPDQKNEKVDIPFPIDPQDRILKRLESGHLEADIFQGGFAIEKMRLIVSILSRRMRSGNPRPQ